MAKQHSVPARINQLLPRLLFSQNCRGLKVDSRIDEITDALVQRHAYAAGFQETWRKGKEQLLCASTGSLFLGVGPDEDVWPLTGQGA